MWIPTHVKVTVHKARNLKVKGQSGVNDPYVIIHLDNTKYTTSVKTRSRAPEWNENCDMPIPSDLRNSFVRLSVHHRNLFSMDDCLGETYIFLQKYPIYERPQSRWYSLVSRRGSRKTSLENDEDEALGEVQVTLTFMVQSRTTSNDQTGAPSSKLQRQRSLSFRALASQVGMTLTGRWRSQSDLKDSPLTDLTERKFPVHSVLELDKVSRSFHDLHLSPADDDDDAFAAHRYNRQVSESDMELATPSRNAQGQRRLKKELSEDEKSLNNDREKAESSPVDRIFAITDQGPSYSTPTYGEILRKRPVRPRSLHTLTEESQESKKNETIESINNAKNVYSSPNLRGKPCGTPANAENYTRAATKRHSYIECGETPPMVAAYTLNEIEDFMTTEKQRLCQSTNAAGSQSQLNIVRDKDHFEGYDRDDLIKLVLEQQSWMQLKQAYVQDLEHYIDGLLIRVLDTNHQAILEYPYNRIGNRSQQTRKADDSQKWAAGTSKKKRLIDILKMWTQ